MIIGLDLHRNYSYVTAMREDGVTLDERSLPNEKEAIRDYLSAFSEPLTVVFEATRNWYWLCDLLQREERVMEVVMAHPKKTKAIAEAKIKTDRIDSRMLAHLKRADLLPESWLAPLAVREVREWLRHRIFLVRKRAAVKTKIRSLLAKLNLDCPQTDVLGKGAQLWLADLKGLPEVFSAQLRDYLKLGNQLTALIEEVEARIEECGQHSEVAELLATIPGVGVFTALLLESEIGDIDRFPSPKKLAAYCGLVPSVHSSGQVTRRGKITKEGNRWLRWALVEAAGKVKERSAHYRRFYERILHKKGKKVARVACARKLAVTIYWMWKRREPFQEPSATWRREEPAVQHGANLS